MRNKYNISNRTLIMLLTIYFLLILHSCGIRIKSDNQDHSEIVRENDGIQDYSKVGSMNITNDKEVGFQDIIKAIENSLSDNSGNISIGNGIEINIELGNIKEGYVELGYLLIDIDNDGREELIIGTNATEKFDDWAGSIYMIFATVDNNVIQVVNGSSRNCYYVCEDGTVASISFSDAFSSGYSFFKYQSGKLNLIESIIRIESEQEDNTGVIWLYSDSYTYEEVYDTEKFDVIDVEKANLIRDKYTFTYPIFIPFTYKE